MNTLTIEGNIINHDGERRGQIIIDRNTGLIQEVTEKNGGADIALKDELIFPGFGDLHIHAREDQSEKWNYKEDFSSVSQAAISGGVTFALDLTNGFVPLTTEAVYRERKALAEKKAKIDITLSANIGPETQPFSFPAPYKVFMTASVGPLFFESKQQLEDTLKNYVGQTINFHCEDPEILAQHASAATHEARRPAEAEEKGIEFALQLIEKYNIKGKICHVTTQKSLEQIVAAKARGINVTCEVTPWHLFFDESMLTENNRPWLQVNPPIRTAGDRQALLEGLKRGDIDFLATDHAPHTKEEKLVGTSGLPGLDTYGAFVTWLMCEHGFTPQDIARVCSFNPGNFINPFLPKNSGLGFGTITPGYVGSLTIIDMDKKTLISEANLRTKCGWSPFTGQEFAGSVKYAIIRGRVYEPTESQI